MMANWHDFVTPTALALIENIIDQVYQTQLLTASVNDSHKS